MFTIQPRDDATAANEVSPNHFQMPLVQCPYMQEYLAQNGFHCIMIIHRKDKSVPTSVLYL